MPEEENQQEFSQLPAYTDPLNYMSAQRKTEQFLRTYVDNEELLEDLFNRLTGTTLTDDDPPKRKRAENTYRCINETGANQIKMMLKNSGLDKNGILSNTSEERVMQITKYTTILIMDNIIMNSDRYEVNLVRDLDYIIALIFNTLELALRRSINRRAAADVSTVSHESMNTVNYQMPQNPSIVQPRQGFMGKVSSLLPWGR